MPRRPRQPARAPQPLSCRRPLSTDVHRVNRLAGRHEEPVTFRAAKRNISADLGYANATEQLALRIPHGDSAVADRTPGVARHPEVAFDVAAKPVRSALHAVDDAIAEQGAVRSLVVGADVEC